MRGAGVPTHRQRQKQWMEQKPVHMDKSYTPNNEITTVNLDELKSKALKFLYETKTNKNIFRFDRKAIRVKESNLQFNLQTLKRTEIDAIVGKMNNMINKVDLINILFRQSTHFSSKIHEGFANVDHK